MSVNGKAPRLNSKWKHKVFRQLSDRDGPSCAMCGTQHRFIWRSGGVWTGLDWGSAWPREPMWRGRYTVVNRSSILEVDHKVPLAIGGTNQLGNLWLLCRECHQAKTSAEQSVRQRCMA